MLRFAAILLASTCLAAVAAGCGAPTVAAPREPAVALPPAATALQPGQVVVLPLLGADHLRSGDWDVPHLVRVIEALGPDTLIVDVTPAQLALCEATGAPDVAVALVEPSPELLALVGLRPELPTLVALARRMGAVVIASGVYDPDARAARDEWFRRNPFGTGSRDYLAARAAWQAAWLGRDAANDLGFLLSDEYATVSGNASRWLSYYAEDELGGAGELRGLTREAAAAEDAIAAAPGGRFVVLTGHERRYYVEGALRARFQGAVIPASALIVR